MLSTCSIPVYLVDLLLLLTQHICQLTICRVSRVCGVWQHVPLHVLPYVRTHAHSTYSCTRTHTTCTQHVLMHTHCRCYVRYDMPLPVLRPTTPRTVPPRDSTLSTQYLVADTSPVRCLRSLRPQVPGLTNACVVSRSVTNVDLSPQSLASDVSTCMILSQPPPATGS